MEQHKQLGISLLEILLIIMITAGMLILATRYFSTARRNTDVLHAVNQVKRLDKASYQWLSAQRQADFSCPESSDNCTPISLTALINAGLIEDTDNNKKDPWGGDINLAPGTNTKHLRITLKKVTESDCLNLRAQLTMVAVTQSSKNDCTSKNYYGEF